MKHMILVLIAATFLAGCQQKEAPSPVESAETTVADAPSTMAPPAPVVQAPVTLPPEAPIPATGVALWLVASDAAGDAVEGKVDSWTNALVSGVSAKAMSPQARPAVVADGINSRTAVRFDGQDDMLVTSIDMGTQLMPEATVVAVFTSATEASSPLRKLYGNDNGSYDRAVGLDDRAGEEKNYALFTGSGVTGYFALQADKPYVTIDQYSPKEFSGWVNGAVTLSKVPAFWGDALPNLYLGGTGTIFSEFWKGDLAEIIIYARILSEEERKRVEDYMSTKYGLTLSPANAETTSTP